MSVPKSRRYGQWAGNPAGGWHKRRRDWRALGGAVFLAVMMSMIYVVFAVLEDLSR